MMTLQTVSATPFSMYLPGGKNYLDPDNLEVHDTVMNTIDSIYVKQNQEYTLSFPDYDLLGDNIFVVVEGMDVYVDEVPFQEQCSHQDDVVVCTFVTSSDEERIHIQIAGDYMSLYYSYYQFDYFQLEEGGMATEYEPYVPPYVDSGSPSFDGVGAFVTSYDSIVSIEDIISSHIVAYDEVDGDVSDQILIVSNQYTGNEQIVGEYLVELEVSDTSGNRATFDLYVIVKDEIAPVIVGPEEIHVNVDQEWSLEDILSNNLSYSDEYDETVQRVVTLDEYSTFESVIGMYTVVIEVEDQFGNQATHHLTIYVEDQTTPMLNGSSIVDIDVDSPKFLDEIVGELDVSDNYDSTVEIEIIQDEYSGNETQIGTYFADVKLMDSSYNELFVTLTIVVSDNASPVFEGPVDVTISYTEFLSIEEIKQMFVIVDNYEELSIGDIVVIVNQYESNYSVPGLYLVELEIQDSSGNIATHIIEIQVIDDVAPILYIDQHIVVVESGSTFGMEDMLKLLRLVDDFEEEEYQIDILQDEYKGNETVPGNYIYKVQLTDKEGNKAIREFNITVQQEDETINLTIPLIYTSIGIVMIVGVVVYKKIK